MKRELPKPSRSLKSFVLDEDAKVIDRTATKVAITASFIAINLLANADDANAKGHKNHSDHQNNVNAPNNFGTGIHGGNNPTEFVVNNITDKAVETWHSNHYNHTDAGGGQGMLGSILGAVAVAAAASGVGGAFAATLSVAAVGWGATAAFVGAMGVGAYAGGALMPEGGEGVEVNTGTPHHIPEPILQILREEED